MPYYLKREDSDLSIMADVKLPPLPSSPSKTFSRKHTVLSTTSVKKKDDEKDEPESTSPRLESRNLSRASFKALQRKRKTKFTLENATTFDPSEPYDFDEDEEDAPKAERYATQIEQCRALYRKSCKRKGLIPIKKVLQQIGQTVFSIDDLQLSARELKVIFVSIANNLDVLELDLSGNKLGVKEISYLCQILKSNKQLSVVIMRKCNLHGPAMKNLADFLSTSNTLRKLDLGDNDLDDNDAPHVAKIIEKNESIGQLILSQNKLGESAIMIGHAIKENEIMVSLDLSWNHIRGYGAVGIAQGLEKNVKLTTVNLAWNGFGFEGCVALSRVLENNSTLMSLDLANNRVHPPALFELIKGLEKNKTLASLRLAHNPITAPMTSILLNRILHAKENTMKELDIEGVVVDKDFQPILDELQKNRMFIVRYDMALPLNKAKVFKADPKNIFNIDPIRILFFMKEHLRTIDLFLKIDKDSDNSLTREEMQFAFELEGYPISSAALDSVMSYLDTNKDGSVDLLIDRLETGVKRMERRYPGTYREFIEGERKLKRKIIKEREENRAEALRTPNAKIQGDKKQFSQAFGAPKDVRSPISKKAG
ncbi:leucine-rich repeat-containing protein 74B-like [Ylistrum balloti]|uniref:leucine-rich repeat-containing protein 74B-like n=1 Tax=Ylistrum balloti TaxID=509963 RepID=UPI002905C7B8|nr:leucine-rich repeat-containing protein 74B-like [Ylistrum balloti]